MRRLLVTLILGVSLASAAGYEEALRHASVQMQGLVAAATGWDATDAYLYMSLRGDLPGLQALRSGPHRASRCAQGRHEAPPGGLGPDRPAPPYRKRLSVIAGSLFSCPFA